MPRIMIAPDTDRITLSEALFLLADRFMFESRWETHSQEQRVLCIKVAQRLSDHARNVLTAGSKDWALAYLEAGDMTLDRLQEARRGLDRA